MDVDMKRYNNHYDTAKLVIALLIVLIAFGVFLFLNAYSDSIYQEYSVNAFYIFATLATVVSGLLIGLLYVVNNSKHGTAKSSVKVAKTKAVKAKSVKAAKVVKAVKASKKQKKK